MTRKLTALLVTIILCATPIANAATPVSPPLSIAPGTLITQRNWQQYQQFMSEGLIALFEGKYFWHMPKNVVIEVGPTTSIPLPQQYLRDTSRYSAQVRLVRLPAGGYVPTGYVAGIPFPNPSEGEPALAGQRIFWDSYFRYQPRVQHAPSYNYTLDRYGNMTQAAEVKEVVSQLTFLSDPGFPRTVPDTEPYYLARYSEQIAPEQGKYSAILDLTPADPTQFDELYEYVPTLRKSLRLSQAARCSPVFGSDYLIDDENNGPPGLPQLFKIDYLGDKTILALEHATLNGFDSPGSATQLDERYYYRSSQGVIPFPKPTLGKWELRDTYVISLQRLPQFAGHYCYSKRVMYIDKENYLGGQQLDLYDPDGNLFKSQLIFLAPKEIPETHGDVAELVTGPYTGLLVNFRGKHVTISPGLHSCVNTECVKDGYLDTKRYASPEGLTKIVQ